jgi:pSer/pThr/pTyr-binding forkhead associated (FHA) protein
MKSSRRAGAGPASDPPRVLEGATHLLVSTVGESDVVHVLGRRTTIGRTADNDLRIDSEAISRHHAVIVCGPINAVVEDLGSTNGVQVNGQRVRRHVLRDGDALTIGRSQFRFVVRAPPAPVTGRGPLG